MTDHPTTSWTDPDAPGYRVAYDPADRRWVGHGADFGADLYYLYRAGRVHVPDTAARFSSWTTTAHDLEQRTFFLDGSVGGREALRSVEAVRAELAEALRRTTTVLDDVGASLVAIAADFATTDAEAAAEFNRLVRSHPGLLGAPTPVVPRPPLPSEPFSTSYDVPSLVAPERPFWVSEGLEAVVVAGAAGLGAVLGALTGRAAAKRKEGAR